MTNKEVIERLNLMQERCCNGYDAEAINYAIKALEDRPQGEWIVGEYMDCHSDILPKYTCPFCREVAYRKYDFCHCGADMRGGRE